LKILDLYLSPDGEPTGGKWTHRIAAPLSGPDDPPLPVPLWCRDVAGLWSLVVEGQIVRPLTEEEAYAASVAVGLPHPGPSPSRAPLDLRGALSALGLAPPEDTDTPPTGPGGSIQPASSAPGILDAPGVPDRVGACVLPFPGGGTWDE
jgi:hypothetical protein